MSDATNIARAAQHAPAGAPPRVTARDTGGALAITCPWCAKTHFHGKGGGLGHRQAHCAPTVPGRARGYVIAAIAIPTTSGWRLSPRTPGLAERAILPRPRGGAA